MRKRSVILLILVLIFTLIFGIKSFATESCKIQIVSNSSFPKKEDEIEVVTSVRNINSPIVGISYTMSFDDSTLELIGQVESINNWEITKIENTFFLYASNYEAAANEQDLCKLKFRVKDSATLGKTVISFNNLQIVKDNYSIENLNNIDLVLDIGEKETETRELINLDNVTNQTIYDNISKSKAEVILNNTSFTYNEKVQKPNMKIIGSDGNEVDSSNYTISYSNKKSKKVGKYTVTIDFKGKYEGTKTLEYEIKPKGTKINKLIKAPRAFGVSWKKQKNATTGYQIQYSTNKKLKKNNKKVKVKTNNTTSVTINKLKKNKKYYVRIRSYKEVKINGKTTKIYSNWSKIQNIITK